MSDQRKFSSSDVRGVLLAVGYSIEEIVLFMENAPDWFPAWQVFDRRALDYAVSGRTIGGMAIINEMRADPELKKVKAFKINNNWQPYFCAMFNGKHEVSYFEQRRKNNKSAHGVAA